VDEVITMTEMARRQFETERVEKGLSDQAGLRVRFAGMG